MKDALIVNEVFGSFADEINVIFAKSVSNQHTKLIYEHHTAAKLIEFVLILKGTFQ